jgi:hypothetical protein
MAYIGKSIESGTFSVLDTSGNTYNGSNVTFSLGTQVGSPAQLLVSHDGVIQKPGTDYSLATGGTQITFSTAPASGASIFIVEISGAVGGPLDSDLNGTELILDADADTSITADTDDQIDIKVAGTDQITIKDGAVSPVTDNDVDLGTSSLEFKDGYFDGTLHCDVLDLAGTEHTSLPSFDGAVVINESSADVDFRVESNGATHMLTVDGGNDVVGISSGGFMGDLGDGLHIKKADSGASALADAHALVIESNADTGISILQHTGGNGTIAFGDSDDNNIGMLQYFHGSTNAFSFTTNAEEQVRFTGSTQNVNINYGETSITGNVALHVAGQASANTMSVKHKDTGGGTVIAFTDGDNQACGSISVDGSANTTAYNTSSDYRLKENINYDFDATTEIKKLKPAKFNWKTNSSLTIEGFLAHEVSSIVPIAVQGDKDATETKQKVVLGKNGNLWQYGIEKSDFDKLKVKWNAQTENVDEELKGATWHAEKVLPKYQTMDASKLVPLLVKTVQELEARIATLEG